MTEQVILSTDKICQEKLPEAFFFEALYERTVNSSFFRALCRTFYQLKLN